MEGKKDLDTAQVEDEGMLVEGQRSVEGKGR